MTLAAFRAIAAVLAVKVLLLLSLVGAFTLALYAMQWQSTMGLAVFVAWCLLGVLPMVVLEITPAWRRRQ